MAPTPRAAAGLGALLAACLLGSALAGVHFDTGVQYPGITGTIPAVCEGGDDYDEGSPSQDFELSQAPMRKTVSGDEPEQIHITQGATPADMYISWATGNAVYTYCSETDGAKCGDAKNACECNQTAPTMTSSQVKYGTDAALEKFEVAQDAGTYPVVNQYTQIYGPLGKGDNYTSPLLHTIKVTGLSPKTRYYYQVGDGVTFSKTYDFTTLPAVGSNERVKIVVTADLGTTHATYEVLNRFTEGHDPDIVLLAGDHTYADNHDNDQRYWDAWLRMLQPSASRVPCHEEETQWTQCVVDYFAAAGCGNLTATEIANNCGSPINSNSSICPCYDDDLSGEKGAFRLNVVFNHCNGNAAFVSATARWPTPYAESKSTSNHYYSFEFGLVHAISLSPYQPICGGSLPCAIYNPDLKISGNSSPQYTWLANDLAAVKRTATPWIIVYFHNPWYTTWSGFKGDDCSRQALEPLLNMYGADLVYNGHIHAYERSNPVNNMEVDPAACNTAHIVVGDAGNDESLECGLIDRRLDNGKLVCGGKQLAQNTTEGYYFPCTSHTFQDSPYLCQKNDARIDTSVYPTSLYGCQEDGYCPNKQPIWSAYRAAAYGSGLLTIYNTTHARWHWNGFIRNNVNAAGYTDGEPEIFTAETIYMTRCDKPAIGATVPKK